MAAEPLPVEPVQPPVEPGTDVPGPKEPPVPVDPTPVPPGPAPDPGHHHHHKPPRPRGVEEPIQPVTV